MTSITTHVAPRDEARFWDRIAPRYARRPIADEAAYEHKLALTRRFLRPEMTLLEFGCGTGGTALKHAPHVRKVHATDISPGMIALAREKARDVDNVALEVAAIETLKAPDASYDMVLTLSLLHLVADRQAALRRVADLLKPGGLFVSSTACLAEYPGLLRVVLPVGRWLGLLPRIAFFSAAGLEAEIRDAGFVIEERFQPGPRAALFLIARKT